MSICAAVANWFKIWLKGKNQAVSLPGKGGVFCGEVKDEARILCAGDAKGRTGCRLLRMMSAIWCSLNNHAQSFLQWHDVYANAKSHAVILMAWQQNRMDEGMEKERDIKTRQIRNDAGKYASGVSVFMEFPLLSRNLWKEMIQYPPKRLLPSLNAMSRKIFIICC